MVDCATVLFLTLVVVFGKFKKLERNDEMSFKQGGDDMDVDDDDVDECDY